MGRLSFENYGKKALLLNDYPLISGRYSFQKEAEKYIQLDIIKKLKIKPDDTCLEIGCGIGTILIPISFLVKKITGIDHNLVIEKLKERFTNSNNVTLVPGNFLDLKINLTYNKIIVYSVLHYLKDEKEVFDFIEKTVSILAPDGKILFGDIPNKSRKNRFLLSLQSKEFIKEWERKKMKEEKDNSQLSIIKNLPVDKKNVEFDDDFILKIIKKLRDDGFHAYVLSQPPELPFGFTREDILVEKLV